MKKICILKIAVYDINYINYIVYIFYINNYIRCSKCKTTFIHINLSDSNNDTKIHELHLGMLDPNDQDYGLYGLREFWL